MYHLIYSSYLTLESLLHFRLKFRVSEEFYCIDLKILSVIMILHRAHNHI